MTSVLYEKKQLQQLRTKRTAQKNASAPEQEGKTAEQLANELGLAKTTVTRAIAELWGSSCDAVATQEDLAIIEHIAGVFAKEQGGVQAQKVFVKTAQKLSPRGAENASRQTILSSRGAENASRQTILSDCVTKNVTQHKKCDATDDFKIPAPRMSLINRNWTYVITEQQERLIRCLLVPNRKELAQQCARMEILAGLLVQVAAEAQLSSDRFEFALDLKQEPALRDDASRVAELERQVAELKNQNTELKNKVVAKHEALLRMEGERNAYKDLYLGAQK